MSTLVSPGVSVPIINDSFYIPVSAPTVPLFFIATRANKLQPDGMTPALGTSEYSVVRTITSTLQSTTMYGIPHFRTHDADANLPIGQKRQLHGDARNEYGLFALNQFLDIGNRAYVVRANIDLADGDRFQVVAGTPLFSGIGNGAVQGITINQLNAVAENWTISCIDQALGSFSVVGSVSGPQTMQAVAGSLYDNGKIGFTILQGTTPYIVGDTYVVSTTRVNMGAQLGPTDATKRGNIVAALQAEVRSNQEVRSEIYEYNLILCPGYFELIDELQDLSGRVNDEAFVIADCPFDKNSDDVATWAMGADRFFKENTAYYYPHGLASNLDGANVFCAASGIALKTFAFSDSVAELWSAPAGARRGVVTGVAKVGYVSGELGTATTFIETNLNQGQRDNLYEFGKNVNPIVFFPGRGLIVWGQKTSANAASARDRVNVERLLMYIKRSLRKGAFPFVFEPNDQITRDNLKAAVDGFLGDILIKRGLYDFVTLSDKSNNTPTRIDRNELWCDIGLKPVKTAEFIYIPVRVLSTGAKL